MPRKQKRIAAADCETQPFKHGRSNLAPFVWGFFDGETYVYFWDDDPKVCTEEFLEYLKDEQDIIIYMHNGGKFDFHFLLPYLDDDIMMINGRIAKATLFDGKVEIRDSLLILPIALSVYEKTEIDYGKFEPEVRNLHKQEIIDYLGVDCRSLYDLVKNFIDRFGLNLTVGSTAFKQFKKLGYDIPSTNEYYDEKIRPFYFGGRVQCFDVGNFYGEFDYVDINSAYPWAMLDKHWYGTGFINHLKMPDVENGSWFAKIEATPYGALPYRHSTKEYEKGKLYFPNDEKRRIYWASGWEIQAGLDTNTLKIHKVLSVYKCSTKLSFEEYVDKFFEEKKSAKLDGDFFKELFAKFMLNSLYGKYGQDGRQFEKFCIVEFGDWPKDSPNTPHEKRWKHYCDTNGMSVFCRDDPSYRFFNVATAASITGKVRSFMWRSLNQCDTPLYCDTDSIICKKFNGDIGNELGQWKLEAKLKEIHIAQRKMYAGLTDDGKFKIASKGVKLDFDQIKTSIKNASVLKFKKESPAVSVKSGFRYFEKNISFENLQKNIVTNPD